MKIPPANLWMIQPTQNSPRSLSSTATTEGKTDVERLRRSSLWFCRFFREIKQHILVIHSGRGDNELGLAAGGASEVTPRWQRCASNLRQVSEGGVGDLDNLIPALTQRYWIREVVL